MTVLFNSTDLTNYFGEKGIVPALEFFNGDPVYAIDGTDLTNNPRGRFVLKCSCRELTTTERDTLFTLLKGGWITVTITTTSGTEFHVMRCTEFPEAQIAAVKASGMEVWAGCSFKMAEKTVS